MEDLNEFVSLVEDFAESILEYISFPPEKYDDYFDMLTRDIYIYILLVVKKFS